MTLSAQTRVSGTLNLCLNGHTVSIKSDVSTRHFWVTNGSTLRLSNCSDKGMLTGGKASSIMSEYDKVVTIEAYNVLFQGNAYNGATGGGGAVMLQGKNSTLKMVGCRLIENTAGDAGGAIRIHRAGCNVTLIGCEIKNNTAKTISAIRVDNTGTLNLIDTVVEGNTTTETGDASLGAVHAKNTACVINIEGKSKITGNTDGNDAAANLFLQNAAGSQPVVNVTAKGLHKDANIGVYLHTDRLAAADGLTITGALNGANVAANFAADNAGYEVKAENDVLVLGVKKLEGHTHKVCNQLTCDDGHENVTYQKWEDATKLPTSGNYYLTTDVTLSAQTDLSGTTLNLCLNGHTVKAADGKSIRHFMLANNAKLVLSNCDADHEGILTGGKGSSIMTNSSTSNASAIELYNIVLKGNSYSGGGAVMLQGKSSLKAVSCKFNDNTGTSSGGAMRLYGTGAATLINCEVKGNTAPAMSAIRLDNGTLTLIDTVIEGNTATKAGDASYGAVYMTNSNTRKLTVSGATRITGNKDKDGKPYNVFFQNSVGYQGVLTVDGLSGNALIGVSLQAARLGAADGMAITAKLNGANPVEFLASDNETYMPLLKDDVVILGSVAENTHKHNVCGDDTCTEHEALMYQPWDSATSLPTTGNYFLTQDVTVSAQTKLSGTTLNLCLNGHTVTVKAGSGTRHFYLEKSAKLTVSNCNAEKDGILTGGQASSIMTANAADNKAQLEMYNVVLQGNKYSGGGAMMIQGAANATLVGCKLLNNTATGVGGAIRHYGSGTVTLIGCEVKGNTAKTTSAIRMENGLGKLVLIDTVIEGNSTTTDDALNYGALYAPSSKYSITLEGQTRITGNTDKAGNPANVYLRYDSSGNLVLTVGEKGLSGNVLIGITMRGDRLTATDGRVVTAKLNGKDMTAFFQSDKDGYEIILKDDVVYLDDKSTHVHKVCGDASCTEHADVKFKSWTETTKLPASGNYCLENDVQLASVVSVSGDLTLCLNGHTVTAKKNERHFDIRPGNTLTVTDCKETGKITGGVRTFGGAAVNVNAGSTFNLYGGTLTGNSTIENANGNAMGGAIFLYQPSDTNPGGVFNMYGGTITGNSSTKEGGAIYGRNGSVINIYDGTISKNTANRGGAIATAAGATVNIYGGTVSENSATNRGGAIYVTGSKLNISGGKIDGNTSTGAAGAIMAASGTVITMTGGTICGSTGSSGGAILMENAGTTMILSGGEITNNSGSAGGGIFASTNTVFTMNDGIISNNTSASTGGGIHALRANVTLAGGEIKNNTAATNGGGVEVEAGIVTMTGCVITGNSAKNGGGMYITGAKSGDVTYQPTVSLAGGQITGNTATGMGGGVTTRDASFEKLELSGNIQITGNTANGKTSNLYMIGEALFSVGTMGENAKVGVSTQKVYGSVSTKTDKDCSAAFTSDNSTLAVVYKDSTVYLQPADGHAHCLCNDKSTFCKDHGTTVFAPWSDATKLPSTPGNYYLTVDVKLSAVCNVFDDINLCLNGHTITPAKNERTFAVNPGYTLSVADCTEKGKITGGVRNYGGVINVNGGATFNLYGGSLTGNQTVKLDGEAGKGGAVYLTAAQEDQPGGVFNMYGGSITENKTFWGGAIYICDGATANIYAGTIANNEAMDRAGAICADGKCVLNIYGGTIAGNTAAKGGAIYTRNGSQINMTGGVISKNSTKTTFVDDKQISKASGGGALALTNKSVFTMTGGEFNGNTAQGAGGAILMESKETKLILKDGKFTGNSNSSDGGAIYASRNTILEMSGGQITGNTSKKNGGGIYILQADVTISGGSVSYNSSKEGSGGGIGMGTGTLNLRGGNISYNRASTSGKGGGIMMNGATLNIYGGHIYGNTVGEKSSGGAAICTSTASETKNGVKQTFYSKINMYGGTISGHTGRNGGAILLQSQTVMNMSGGTMRDNEATVDGGAVCLYSKSTFDMSGGSLLNNKAAKRGGAIYYSAGTGGAITGGTATGNFANDYGGFINAHGIDTKIVMKDMKITGNEAKNYGGAVAITWNAVLDMDDCEFYENKGGEGGAMYLAHKTTCYLDNVKVYKNYSTDAGGAFYLDVGNNINFTNVKILDNESAGNGGAIYTRANVHLVGCLISGNVSGKDGGGIATSGAWTYGNLPENTNGYVGRGQGMILENTVITGNTCVGRGGGVFMAKKNWNTIINCEITNNTCGETGSALFVGDDLLVKGGMTVTGNTSKTNGYAVYFRENSYDGQSYMQAIHEIGGNVIIRDNVGGDVMLCAKVVLGNTAEGYGEDTYINMELSDGLLTDRIAGAYNYEGSGLCYTITYGDRSYMEPMVKEAQEEPQQTAAGDIWLYVGIGAFVAVLAALVVLILAKKKKAGKPAAETPKE